MNIVERIKTRLKINDNVVVIAGSDRGRRGKVLFIDRKRGRIVVEGINKRQKFVKPSQDNPKGGMISREFPINISNVMYFCDKCKQGVRIGVKESEKANQRICKKCGKTLDK